MLLTGRGTERVIEKPTGEEVDVEAGEGGRQVEELLDKTKRGQDHMSLMQVRTYSSFE
jgi:hypothetical protein